MRIKLLPEAELELNNSLAEYGGIGSPTHSFSDEAQRVFEQLARFPASGSKFGRIRRCLFHGYPYAVIYQIYSDHILVISVMHTSRRPGYWRSRVRKK